MKQLTLKKVTLNQWMGWAPSEKRSKECTEQGFRMGAAYLANSVAAYLEAAVHPVVPQLAVHPVVPAVHPVVPGVQVAQLAVQPEPMEVAGVQVAQPMVVLTLAMALVTVLSRLVIMLVLLSATVLSRLVIMLVLLIIVDEDCQPAPTCCAMAMVSRNSYGRDDRKMTFS
jgi:hypothetical protein